MSAGLTAALLAWLMAAPAQPARRSDFVAWRMVDGYLITSRDLVVKAVARKFGVLSPHELAVHPSGAFVVFSAKEGLGLWKADLPNGAPVRISADEAFYAAPSFSQDGRWLFVSSYPNKVGGMDRTLPDSYAQVLRFSTVDWSESPRWQTRTVGCKMGVTALDSRVGVVLHADCNRGARTLEWLRDDDTTSAPEVLRALPGAAIFSVEMSSNAKRLLRIVQYDNGKFAVCEDAARAAAKPEARSGQGCLSLPCQTDAHYGASDAQVNVSYGTEIRTYELPGFRQKSAVKWSELLRE